MRLVQFSLVPFRLLPLSLLLFLSTGCDTSGDNDFFDAEVTDLDVHDEAIHLGEGTVVRAAFGFDNRAVFEDHDNVALVVKLPAGLSYREGTAELHNETGDDSIGAQITQCPDGTTFLLFDMDRHDLNDLEDPSGDALGDLTLTVDGNFTGPWLIEARARQDVVFFGCNQVFNNDASVYLTVLQ